jgi:hypothetical protein
MRGYHFGLIALGVGVIFYVVYLRSPNRAKCSFFDYVTGKC